MQVVVAVQFCYYDFNNAVAMVQPNYLYCLNNLSQIAGSCLGIQYYYSLLLRWNIIDLKVISTVKIFEAPMTNIELIIV